MMWLLIAALLCVGMALLVAEVAVIPGFGVAGISAIVLLGGGVGLAWYSYGVAWGIGALLLAGGATVATLVIAPRTRAGKSLVLDTSITARQPGADLAGLVGAIGRTATPLRPAGAAALAGRRVDVSADGEFIPAGALVCVVRVEGTRVVVARADNTSAEQPPSAA